ncbi:MAG TPA: ABC transporter permease [Thermoanaerobaculia bacterium]|nr:ABC transporter permease [Thermoanaerobaculia bacterium]
MHGLFADLYSGARQLRRRPGLTAAAVLALGLGVGANAALFSVFATVVLEPPPYPDPERLLRLWARNDAKAIHDSRVSPVAFDDLRDQAASFERIAGWWRPELNLTGDEGEPQRVSAIDMTSGFFDTVGVRPALGDTFVEEDELASPITKVVLSHALWQERFGLDPVLVGRTIQLDGQGHQVVGVMPAGFDFPPGVQVYRPLGWDAGRHSRAARFFEVVARLRQDVPIEAARAEVARFVERWQQEFPDSNAGWTLDLPRLHEDEVGGVRQGLVVLLAAVAVVLLIACVNVAGLLIAHGSVREREVSLRFALGAGRGRLVRQFLAEGLVLAALGGLAGCAFAVLGVRALVAAAPAALPRVEQVRVDPLLLGTALGLALLSTLLFALVPALRNAGRSLHTSLQEGGRGSSRGRRGVELRSALVVLELALAVSLLVAAGLLLRSFGHLLAVDVGARAERALLFDLQLPRATYPDYAAVNDFYLRALERLETVPDIDGVAAAAFLPLEEGWRCDFSVLGRPAVDSREEPEAQYRPVGESWFRALGIPVLEGRGFEPTDRADRPGVVAVNRSAARRYWGETSPVGERVALSCRTFGPLGAILVDPLEAEVVGVVGDVKNNRLEAPAEPALYFPIRQFGYRNMSLLVRTTGRDATSLVEPVKAALWELDPSLPLSRLRTFDDHLAAATARRRFVVALLGFFAGTALVLAALGVHGVLAETVAAQRRELGVRTAMGATPLGLLWLVFRRGLSLVGVGLVVGLLGALAARRLIASQLYGVGAFDPLSLGGAIAVLVAAACLACWAPAARAARTAPAAVLRGDSRTSR